MDDDARRKVGLLGANLAFIVAGLHLLMGLRYWVLYATGGNFVPPDVRVPMWTASAVAIFAGMSAIYAGAPRRPIYALGAALMAVYVLGYFSWHLGGHGEFYLGLGQPYLHGADLGTFLLDHLFAGPLEFASILLETALFVVLVVLFFDEG